MTDPLEAAAVVALLRSGDRSWPHYANLIESVGSARKVITGDFDEDDDPSGRLFEVPERAMHAEPDLSGIVAEVEQWGREGMRLLTVLDAAYPANLRTIHNRPPILFLRGELDPADERSIAVVGTRAPTDAGHRLATRVASELAGAGYVIVSGLAKGVDTVAHHAALDASRRTVAVVGTGLRRAYPPENKDLQDRIAREGAVLSQFWPDAPPTQQTFPQRNVVMSGFALATVVVEAGEKSGARIQARHALGHGRPVFLSRSAVASSTWAREYAARPGVHEFDSPDDVLRCMERLTAFDALSA
jgi:DNA processing protein